MSKTDYPGCIDELYQSEVLGEQAFLALMSVAKNARDKYHFGTFLQLESETKARLRPFMQKYDLEFEESKAPEEQIAGFVAAYQQNTWRDFVAGLAPLIEQFLARFIEVADAGPAEDQEILRSMITHEQSYAHWIEKELAGEKGSLDLAISQLQYPMPAM